MISFSDLTWHQHQAHHGEYARVHFPNGYGASILRGGEPYTYTANGTYELAVLHGDSLDYTTPITSDVLPNLTADEVTAVLHQIEQLHERA